MAKLLKRYFRDIMEKGKIFRERNYPNLVWFSEKSIKIKHVQTIHTKFLSKQTMLRSSKALKTIWEGKT